MTAEANGVETAAKGGSVDTTSDNDAEALSLERKVAHWFNEIDAASKREKDWRKEGERILKIYSGQAKTPFNILYSNTETMLPALYSAVPRPVVQRRFKDADPLGKLAAQAAQRVLEFLIDTNFEGYETYDQGMRSAVLDALLPGRGVTDVKYEAEIVEVDGATSAAPAPGAAEGTQAPAAKTPVKNWESVCPDSVRWDRVLFGYATKWSKVPWKANELHLDKEEAKRIGIPEDVIAKITFTEGEDAPSEGDGTEGKTDDERNTGEKKTALFWQIWDRDGGRKVRYICSQYKDDFCLVQDDPLELTGFFNCPKPVVFLEKSGDLIPVALYVLYENQATELNSLSTRIKSITAAIKARALYDTELGDDVKALMDADEPVLVPADKSSSLAAEKGLQNAIWFWPVEQLITVLRELYAAREACKQVIYEIMGIADIMRGASRASETLGAQEIKTQWGSLRLKRLQKEVQRYARDMLRMMLEVAAKKFSERTWAQMTGLPFITTEDFQRAQMVAQASQAAGVQLDQQTQAKLQMPVWGEILKTLRNDIQRAYRIDIETNSTVEPEATEDQKNIAEVMTALAQYLNGIAPLVINGSMPFEAAQAMLLAIVRRFRFGPEIEDYVKAMKPPQPKDDGKQAEMQKAAMEKESHDAEMRKGAAEFQAEQAERQQKAQFDAAKYQADMAKLNREAEISQQEHAMKLEELRAKAAYNRLMGELKEKQIRAKAQEADRAPA